MTPTGSRSKAQGLPALCAGNPGSGAGMGINPERVAYRTTQPFQGCIFPGVNPGFPAENAGNPGLCYATPSGVENCQ